jgi:hypothetical protein
MQTRTFRTYKIDSFFEWLILCSDPWTALSEIENINGYLMYDFVHNEFSRVTWKPSSHKYFETQYCDSAIIWHFQLPVSVAGRGNLLKNNHPLHFLFGELTLGNRSLWLKNTNYYNFFLSQFCVYKCRVWRGH